VHEGFESLETQSVLQRLEEQLREKFPGICTWGGTPWWLQRQDTNESVASMPSVSYTMHLASQIRVATQRIKGEAFEVAESPGGVGGSEALPPRGAIGALILARLAYGDMLESWTRFYALSIAPVNAQPTNEHKKRMMARVFFDSYVTACVVNSAAVAYGDLLDNHPIVEMHLHNHPCISAVVDMSNLFEFRQAIKYVRNKDASTLLNVLTKSIVGGSRGWEQTLDNATKSSEAVTRFCSQLLAAVVEGMHPLLHPAKRPLWQQRISISLVNSISSRKPLVLSVLAAASPSFKEALRCYISVILGSSNATQSALQSANNALGGLTSTPMNLPHPTLHFAMGIFVEAGEATLTTSAAATSTALCANAIADVLNTGLAVPEIPQRKTLPKRPKNRRSASVESQTSCAAYSPTWIGKNSQASIAAVTKLVSAWFSSTFKSDFFAFWAHGERTHNRALRLDSYQFDAIHHMNAAFRLCCALSPKEHMYATACALDAPNASLMNVRDALALLHPESESELVGMPLSAFKVDAIHPRSLAMLLVFGRVAALRSQIVAYDLGELTLKRQVVALSKRLLLPLPNCELTTNVALQHLKRFPKHSTHMAVCLECKRVANAVQDETSKGNKFDEIGVAACMYRLEEGGGHLRCAKRSSAALKVALAFESASMKNNSEEHDVEPNETTSVLGGVDQPSSARLRRDTKLCYDQHGGPTACGDSPLVMVPVVGKAVKVLDVWYSLCATCGSLYRVAPTGRHGTEICCGQCSSRMLIGVDAEQSIATPDRRACRFCGRVETIGTTTPWRVVAAPVDCTGRNANLPQELRRMAFCPSHFRNWIPAAAKQLETGVILAHISSRARPMIGAECGKRVQSVASADDGAVSVGAKRKRKKRIKKSNL